MKTMRILPVAVAAALFAVASVAQASAATPKMPATSNSLPGTTWTPHDLISLGQAEKLAIEKVGGKVDRIMFYGPGDHNYAFDVKNGNQKHRVYVNGETGRVKVAINMNRAMDPAFIGSDKSAGSDFQGTQLGASYR